MGEEKKEEVKKGEKKGEVKKEEKKKEEEIVLKVDMHCEACARKVARALKGFQGVEEVTADHKVSKVVVKGKAAKPIKVSQRVKKKSGRKVEILSPLRNPINPPQNTLDHKEEDEPPAVVTVVLKVRMHCEACAQALKKRIGKVKGVESVTTDAANDKVTVKGVLDPDKLVADIYKKTGKQASIVKGEEKKEEKEKKEEEKKSEEKKEEKQEEKKQDEEDDKKMDVKKNEHWPPKYYMEHAYLCPSNV